MADSFFGFNTSTRHSLDIVDEPELDEEEEYDAFNDETFGNEAFQGDWEEDHTRFAEVAEYSRNYKHSCSSEKDDDLDLEASLSQLVLESEEEGENEEIANNSKQKHSDSRNTFKFPVNIGNYCSPALSPNVSEKATHACNKEQSLTSQPLFSLPKTVATYFLPPQLSRIPTVQELERDIMQKNMKNKFPNKNREINSINQEKSHFSLASNNINDQNCNTNNRQQNVNIQSQNAHSKFQHAGGSSKFPPGFGPLQPGQLGLAQQQEMVMLRNNQNMPMQLGPMLFPPQHLPLFPPPQILPPSMPHLLLMPQNRMVKPHPMMRYMPPHPLLMQQHHQVHQKQLFQQQLQNKLLNNTDNPKNGQLLKFHINSSHSHLPRAQHANRKGHGDYDEYAGLMNNRERQWLLGIQIIQLAIEEPLIDDYYYTAWSKKKEKEKSTVEKALNGLKKDAPIVREAYFPNNRQPKVEFNWRERKDSDRETTITPYVPQQFENSLGKLQCGSVAAPRKIIDLDLVPERQIQTSSSSIHKDSRKVKKILLELEMLYLCLLNVEDLDNQVPRTTEPSNGLPMSKPKLLDHIMTSYLQEDRFVSFMCIRKGKTLLLRVLSQLNITDHREHLTNLWCRFFKSISVIIRRDQSDGILLQIYPYFNKWINTVDCTILSIIESYLLAANVQSQAKKSSRAVSPNTGKSVLSYISTTTFGISVLSSILLRGESIYPTLGEKEKEDWTNILLNFIKHMTNISNVENLPTPLDPLPAHMITVILNRSTGLHIQDYASAKRVLTKIAIR